MISSQLSSSSLAAGTSLSQHLFHRRSEDRGVVQRHLHSFLVLTCEGGVDSVSAGSWPASFVIHCTNYTPLGATD